MERAQRWPASFGGSVSRFVSVAAKAAKLGFRPTTAPARTEQPWEMYPLLYGCISEMCYMSEYKKYPVSSLIITYLHNLSNFEYHEHLNKPDSNTNHARSLDASLCSFAWRGLYSAPGTISSTDSAKLELTPNNPIKVFSAKSMFSCLRACLADRRSNLVIEAEIKKK